VLDECAVNPSLECTCTLPPPAAVLSGSCSVDSGPVNLNWTINSAAGYRVARRTTSAQSGWNYNYSSRPAGSVSFIDSDSSYYKYNNYYDYNLKNCGDASCTYYSWSNQIHVTCPSPTPTLTPTEAPACSSNCYQITPIPAQNQVCGGGTCASTQLEVGKKQYTKYDPNVGACSLDSVGCNVESICENSCACGSATDKDGNPCPQPTATFTPERNRPKRR